MAALRRPLVVKVVLLLGLLFAVSRVVAPTVLHFRSGDLTLTLQPAVPGGKIRLDLGPFGRLAWNTHTAPVTVDAEFVLSPDIRGFPELEELQDLRWWWLARRLGWLALAGAFAGALLTDSSARRRLRAATVGAAAASALFALVIGVSILTFDSKALNDPHYTGPVRNAPRILQLLKEVRGDLAGVTRNINRVVAGLERIHAQIVAPPAVSPQPAVRLLVVSDLHNNPIGLLLARELVERFEVDGVLNAGDFTDRGSQPEAELFARFAQLDVPHVIVGGNHEDLPTLRRIGRLEGVRVLSSRANDATEVDGITILGETDPNAFFIGSDPRNETAEELIPELCARLAARFLEVRPQVVLVHDPRLGECAVEQAKQQGVPLTFAWGHLHRQTYESEGQLVSVSPGTSGANGLKSPNVAPYGFALLEFDPRTKILSSVCLFAFDNPGTLRDASCHLQPVDEPADAAAATPAEPDVRPLLR